MIPPLMQQHKTGQWQSKVSWGTLAPTNSSFWNAASKDASSFWVHRPHHRHTGGMVKRWSVGCVCAKPTLALGALGGRPLEDRSVTNSRSAPWTCTDRASHFSSVYMCVYVCSRFTPPRRGSFFACARDHQEGELITSQFTGRAASSKLLKEYKSYKLSSSWAILPSSTFFPFFFIHGSGRLGVLFLTLLCQTLHVILSIFRHISLLQAF